jgi:hypothetical protein
VGNKELSQPIQLAIPAPVGLAVGTQVFIMREDTLRDVDGSLKPYWILEESAVVGADGMIRTQSPPFPGVLRTGRRTIQVPKFAYEVAEFYGSINTTQLFSGFGVGSGFAVVVGLTNVPRVASIASVATTTAATGAATGTAAAGTAAAGGTAVVAGGALAVGAFAASFLTTIALMPKVQETLVNYTVEAYTIPTIDELPQKVSIDLGTLQRNTLGIPTIQVPIPRPSNYAQGNPLIESAALEYDADNQGNPKIWR